jgi:hypothetical protein
LLVYILAVNQFDIKNITPFTLAPSKIKSWIIQVVERLPSKLKALSSNPSTTRKEEGRKERRKGGRGDRKK